MHERKIFEYAVMRLVPRVEREEFLNIGVILYCAKTKYLDVRFNLDEERLKAFTHGVDADEIRQHLAAFERICRGDKQAGTIANLDPASRFRWLTAPRSTILQPSRIHPGACTGDPQQTLEKLFAQLAG